jgi:hypothetical protein
MSTGRGALVDRYFTLYGIKLNIQLASVPYIEQ